MTLACEDGNSKLVEVVTVVEVDDEKRVDNSLVQIWKINFGHKVKFLFGLWGQGFKVCSRFWSWCSDKILKLKFGYYFAADAWFWLLSSLLVEILVWFCRNGDVWLRFWSWCKVKILKMFDHDLCLNLWYDPTGYFGKLNSTLRSVVPLAMFIFLTLLRTILHLSTYY